jgi:hypothetical protein
LRADEGHDDTAPSHASWTLSWPQGQSAGGSSPAPPRATGTTLSVPLT